MGISSVTANYSSLVSSTSSNQSQLLKTLLEGVQSQPSLLDILADQESSTASSSGDILQLSSQGQAAADQLYELLESSALNSLQTSANSASAVVLKKLNAALSAAGIDTAQEIDLQLDADGNVTVSNDNAQADAIETAINDNPDLKKAVTQYLKFMQAIAPTIASSDSSSSVSNALTQLLAANDSDSSAAGKVTLATQDGVLLSSYVDSSGNSSTIGYA